MKSVLYEVASLRQGRPLELDYTNNNQYSIRLNEPDGSKTAYYFSAPIYNKRSRKALDMRFQRYEDGACLFGSRAIMTFTDRVRMDHPDGYCIISLDQPVSFVNDQELACGEHRLYPTVNGFMYKAACIGKSAFSFELEVGMPFMEMKSNDKYFSLMAEQYHQYVTVSCLGTADDNGEIVAPAKISAEKCSEYKYRVTISGCSAQGKWVLFEINRCVHKIGQDTTVESANPKVNNVFGTTAFIGHTEEFGEQWLYFGLDFAQTPEIRDKQILSAFVHFPKFNKNTVELSAYRTISRFCSFGSNWDNRIAASTFVGDTTPNGDYLKLDITEILKSPTTNFFTRFDGIILKPKNKGHGFTAIPTGDCCYAPQIYEINYK